MRAVVRQGDITFVQAWPTPAAPNNDEVIVSVGAASINPVDYKAPKLVVGAVVGLDFAGTVSHIGPSPTHDFKVGDVVFGSSKGSLADAILAKATSIARIAKGQSLLAAASMPVTYLTSLQALRDKGGLQKGGRVLIIGASGGCGIAALQLSKWIGASEIVAVCSGRNAELVRQHGATKVVDYTTTSLLDVYPESSTPDSDKFDVVFDAATNSGAGEDYKATGVALCATGDAARRHGQYVAINGAVDMWLRAFTIGQKANQHLFLTDTNTADLALLASLASAEDGVAALVPVIDSVHPFTPEGVSAAFARLKTRRAAGKVVVDVGSRPPAANLTK
jgi:NADPH:quinone reductase-like Zn-dependent oxidoreductase